MLTKYISSYIYYEYSTLPRGIPINIVLKVVILAEAERLSKCTLCIIAAVVGEKHGVKTSL